MLAQLPLAILAAALFAVSGSAAMLGTAAPAIADQPAHRHPGHGTNPYGANGFWSNGAWHSRLAANPGHHYGSGWNQPHPAHPAHPTHPKHPMHPDRDRH